MITVESIRLRNFRAIREVYFQPSKEGITGLRGTNGSGKTSILAGMLFALFGVRPPGVAVGSLRRSNSNPSTDECSVSVVFNHLGQTVEVIREIKGKGNKIVLNIYVDGIEATITSVGAGEKWVKERLGVDAAGFLTAFVVRQKELDMLVKARPAERKAIVERLAGIETINDALKLARKNEATSRTMLDAMPGTESAVEETEGIVRLLDKKVQDLQAISGKGELGVRQAHEATQRAQRESQEAREKYNAYRQAMSEVSSLTDLSGELKRTIASVAYVVDLKDDTDVTSLRNQHVELSAQLRELQERLTAHVQSVRDNEREVATAESEIKRLEDEIARLPREGLEDAKTAVRKYRTQSQEVRDQAATAKSRASDLSESIDALGGHAECPTCHSHLSDPARLISTLTQQRDEQLALGVKAEEESSKLQSLFVEAESLLRGVESRSLAETQLSSWKERREVLVSETPDSNVSSTLSREIEILGQKREEVTEAGLRAKHINDHRAQYQEASSRLASAEDRLAVANKRVADLKAYSSEEPVRKAEQVYQNVMNAERAAISEAREAAAERATYEAKLVAAQRDYTQASDRWRRKQELLQAQERHALTTEVLDKFRRETVASLTPELSDNASDLISDITSGAYTSIKVDDEFNINVLTASGDSRKVDELSGGEESAVALALRLAIGLLITGRNPGLLWLDEVLTAQDSDRRLSMLSTIRELPYSQIVMVSHTDDAADISDHVVTVIPDKERGSVLTVGDEAYIPDLENGYTADSGTTDEDGDDWDFPSDTESEEGYNENEEPV